MKVYLLDRNKAYLTVDAAIEAAVKLAKTVYNKQHFEIFGEKIYGNRIKVTTNANFIAVNIYGTNGELFFDGLLIEALELDFTHAEANGFAKAILEDSFSRL